MWFLLNLYQGNINMMNQNLKEENKSDDSIYWFNPKKGFGFFIKPGQDFFMYYENEETDSTETQQTPVQKTN